MYYQQSCGWWHSVDSLNRCDKRILKISCTNLFSNTVFLWCAMCLFLNLYKCFKKIDVLCTLQDSIYCAYDCLLLSPNKGYWMRNNQNRGWKWNGNLFNKTKYNIRQQHEGGKPLLMVTTESVYWYLLYVPPTG